MFIHGYNTFQLVYKYCVHLARHERQRFNRPNEMPMRTDSWEVVCKLYSKWQPLRLVASGYAFAEINVLSLMDFNYSLWVYEAHTSVANVMTYPGGLEVVY